MANIIEIHDFSDPALDVYTRLTENQLLNRADPDNALFVAESPLVIGRALDAGCEPVSFLMERQHTQGKGREILARCCQDIPVYTADESSSLPSRGRTCPAPCGGRSSKASRTSAAMRGASSCSKT